MSYILQSTIEGILPAAASTIKADALQAYETRKSFIIETLKSAKSSIHLCPDVWSSPSGLGLLGVTCRFIGSDDRLHCLVLSLVELPEVHSGEAMAEALVDLLADYNITPQIGYVVANNATSNDSMMVAPSVSLEQEGILYNPVFRRLRCCGHIVNLVVTDFLFGKHPYRNQSRADRTAAEDTDHWRKAGPLGKLHNITRHIYGSTQRKKEFKALTPDGLGLKRRSHPLRPQGPQNPRGPQGPDL